MKFVDDRTIQEKITHPVIIMGTDSFLSGWVGEGGGKSYAGWACSQNNRGDVEKWVRNRSDMERVRVVDNSYRPSGKNGHCHIYVVHEEHPALN